ncbi:MAG TPA: Na-translocating system protein MpsC family protein [Solirubrobacteraceae bacterium]|nr:Na-translocating system protein MpsC family protein [Solirubrobacteraceae bacterium]
MTAVGNALVGLHKEQFGRGPTAARAYFAGPDTLICLLEDALLPAEQALVDMGEQQRVRDARLFMQVATADRFTARIEEIVGRKVHSFVSALDPDKALAYEIFVFEPAG